MVYGYKDSLINDILDIIDNPNKERTRYTYLLQENDLLIKANTRLADIIKSFDPTYFGENEESIRERKIKESEEKMTRKFKTNVEKYVDNMSRFKHKCKCGHTVYLNEKHPQTLCYWCKTMNYLDPKEEFKAKMKDALKKIK